MVQSSFFFWYRSKETYAFVVDIGEDGGDVLGTIASLATNKDLGALLDSILDVLMR